MAGVMKRGDRNVAGVVKRGGRLQTLLVLGLLWWGDRAMVNIIC